MAPAAPDPALRQPAPAASCLATLQLWEGCMRFRLTQSWILFNKCSCAYLLRPATHLYVINSASVKCGVALYELSVKRPAEKRNSLKAQLRTIQAVFSVASVESPRARCIATPTGPPELKIAICSPRLPLEESCENPRCTRVQKSGQGSISFSGSRPSAQRPITTSNIR